MSDILPKIICRNCQEEINGVSVQCCDCVDFDICVQCFSSGAEVVSHKNNHRYRFLDQVSIFGGRGNWTGKEEVQMLEGLELYGFGNWELISKHVGTRTPEEVKDEYIMRYLEGNIGQATLNEVGNCRPVIQEHISEDKGPLSPEMTSRLPPMDITPEEATALGYMAHRDDYDKEYDTFAEDLISSLKLSQSDTTIETALKLTQVDMYIRRLRERHRRKRIVRDYQLAAKFFADQRKENNKKPLKKEQKTLRENMRVFSQFLTSGEHERLIASVERERELRHRLSELIRYRSVGLTTQEEIIHYEQHCEYQRQQKLKQSKAGSSGYITIIPPDQIKDEDGVKVESSTEKNWHQDEESDSNFYHTTTNNTDSVIAPPPPSTLPQGTLLSQNELKLCSSLELQPVQYVSLKSVIIQDNLISGKNKQAENSATTDEPSIKDVVTQYLNCSGWLSVV